MSVSPKSGTVPGGVIRTTRGTAATLTSKNLVFPAGVLVWEEDTYKLKCGDGSTAWNLLPYVWVDYVNDLKNKPFSFVKLTSDFATSSLTPVNIPGLSFNVVAGSYYSFKFYIAYRALATSKGATVALTVPAFNSFSAVANGVVAVGSTAALYTGEINSSGGAVVMNGVPTTSTDTPIIIDGIVAPNASGVLQLQVAAGVISGISVRLGSYGQLTKL